MKRRKFIAAASTSALISPLAFASSPEIIDETAHEIYDLKTYELKFGSNRKALLDYLKEVQAPYLEKMGARDFMMFMETGAEEPPKLWTLTAFPDFNSYQQSLSGAFEAEMIDKSQSYAQAGPTYNRISSSLLYAFKSIKQMKQPIEGASLFELRIYEGMNEDAVRRKIKMFDEEELDLFYRTDMNPIFFGNMVVGPYMPSLVYMLNFRDMAHRDAAWKDFADHPEWNIMKAKPEYANTVSNIRRVFLKLV